MPDEDFEKLSWWWLTTVSILFLACISKILFPAPLLTPVGAFDIRFFAIALDLVLLAILLTADYSSLLALWSVKIVFVTYIFYLLWTLFNGANRCTCFGETIQLPLWLMLILDSCVLLLVAKRDVLATTLSRKHLSVLRYQLRSLVVGIACDVATGSGCACDNTTPKGLKGCGCE